ncbi:hypothetical protein CPK_ORF00391 [Chlamydia pneumoniae LPCoLN]|nr:hypothetical protein CPK_ORF00391 [Chlamydia pneumoniae LPCoLN]
MSVTFQSFPEEETDPYYYPREPYKYLHESCKVLAQHVLRG